MRDRSHTINVRASKEEAKMLKAIAEHEGVSVSDVVRQSVRAKFAKMIKKEVGQ
jgi:uncharacterized protein (DUF1778 family)